MNDIELELKESMTERAGMVTPLPEMHRTLQRARIRRAVNAGMALFTVVGLTMASFAGVRTFTTAEEALPAPAGPGYTTEGEYGFTSTPGEYPTIASGEFRGAEWRLTAETISEDGIDSVDLKFEIRAGSIVAVDEVAVLATDDVLLNRYVTYTELLDGAHVVFGANVPTIDMVEVDVSDGNDTIIPTHRFLDYDSHGTITADYYLAFVPGDSPGLVHARNELGINVESEPYGGVSVAPHVVASGRLGSTDWGLEFAATDEDRACLVFSTSDVGSECFTRQQVEDAGPLFVVTFERDDVRGVVALISGNAGNIEIQIDGEEALYLPWFEPEVEDRAKWGLRLVVVGLDPGTHGVLRAFLDQRDPLEEERF